MWRNFGCEEIIWFTLFCCGMDGICCKFCSVAIYVVLSQNLFLEIYALSMWRKIKPKILSVEKKWQIWCMMICKFLFLTSLLWVELQCTVNKCYVLQVASCNTMNQNNQDPSLPSESNILRYIWTCRASAIYDIPINWPYIHKRCPALLKTQTLYLWLLQPWHLTKVVDRLSEILKCSCLIVP